MFCTTITLFFPILFLQTYSILSQQTVFDTRRPVYEIREPLTFQICNCSIRHFSFPCIPLPINYTIRFINVKHISTRFPTLRHFPQGIPEIPYTDSSSVIMTISHFSPPGNDHFRDFSIVTGTNGGKRFFSII